MGFACFRLRGPRKRPRGVRGNAPTKKKSPGPIRTGASYVPSASAALGSPVKGFPWRHQCAGGPYEDATSAELLS